MEKKASINILIAGISWGIISIFVKNLSSIGLSSIDIVALRVWFSAIIMIIFLMLKDKSLLKISLKDIPLFVGTGILSIIFFNYCYFKTITESGVSISALLLYTAPIFVMAISIPVLKEKITYQKIFSLICTFVGLMFVTEIFNSNDRLSFKAFMYGIGSGFGFALYSIFGKFLLKKYHSLTIIAYTFIVASIGIIPLCNFNHIVDVVTTPLFWIGSIGISVLCTIIPFLSYTKGLESIEASKASVIATVEPLVASVVGIVFYNERLTTSKILGMILIFIAVIVLNLDIQKFKHQL